MPRPVTNDATVRQRLVDATVRLLSTHRPAQLSVRQIAGEAAASTTAIYALFGDKDGLLGAARDVAIESLYGSLSNTPPTSNPPDDLRLLATTYLDWAAAHPHLYGVLFQGIQTFDPGGALGERDPAAPLMAAVERGIDRGDLEGPPGAIAASLWVALHGIATLVRDGAMTNAVARICAETTIDALLSGWSPRAS
ncbi:TetR/AcrR family transcriptional regulator [Lacisediminihabitans sp.]|uniref:TetR/AcrR family transcriptional regulator n=1 Tax=Lacisediminihabitans sp. TaxID=2787631 RepID=UPI00374CD383